MRTVDKIKAARESIWLQVPPEVNKILKRRDLNHPAGNLLFAESCTRDYAELIWVFREQIVNDKFSDQAARKPLQIILENLSLNLGGFYMLKEGASLVDEVISEIENCSKGEMIDLLDELRVYLSRLELWLDMYIPWYETNEIIRANTSALLEEK